MPNDGVSFDYVLGLAHGLAGEEVSVSWTSGALRNELTPQMLRGVLVDSEGVIRGMLTLSFDAGDNLGNYAEIKVRRDNKVITEVVEYRGAWWWPLQEIYQRFAPVERRGVPALQREMVERMPKHAPRFRPRVRSGLE